MSPRRLDLQSLKARIQDFCRTRQRAPSFSEMQQLLGYRSKGGVRRAVQRLVEAGCIQQDETGRLMPVRSGLRLIGTVQAGFPSPAEEELIDTLSLDEFLVKNPQASYLVKVSGDSMIDAGILPGDLVIVERGREPRPRDIVIAQVDGEWTMKYFNKKGREITLEAANRKYPPIRAREELKIGGVVVCCIRKYGTGRK